MGVERENSKRQCKIVRTGETGRLSTPPSSKDANEGHPMRPEEKTEKSKDSVQIIMNHNLRLCYSP